MLDQVVITMLTITGTIVCLFGIAANIKGRSMKKGRMKNGNEHRGN